MCDCGIFQGAARVRAARRDAGGDGLTPVGADANEERHLSDILIRPATEEDADLIAAIHASSWRDAYAHILAPEFLNGAIEADRLALWSQRLRDRSATQLINVACDPAGLVPAFICSYCDFEP